MTSFTFFRFFLGGEGPLDKQKQNKTKQNKPASTRYCTFEREDTSFFLFFKKKKKCIFISSNFYYEQTTPKEKIFPYLVINFYFFQLLLLLENCTCVVVEMPALSLSLSLFPLCNTIMNQFIYGQTNSSLDEQEEEEEEEGCLYIYKKTDCLGPLQK